MKNWLIAALAVAVLATSVPMDVQAKRLGSGKSAGMQRNMPERTSPTATPAQPAAPAQGQQAAPANVAAATPAAAGAAAAPKRNWLGPIAGLAAGLGLAALFSHLGLGEGLANVLMVVLLAAAAFFLIRFLLRRFAGGGMARTPAMAGAGAGASAPWSPVQRVDPPALADTATQRSTLDSPPAFGGTASGDAPAAAPAVTRAFVPAAFDAEGFARTAKMIFIRLQTAHDTADLDDLKRFTTPELFASLRVDIQERGPAPQHTDVLKVDAEVLDVANEAERQIVSVRFHGQVVEEKGGAPVDFNEVWHLVKPHDDSRSWAIAGIEQMT